MSFHFSIPRPRLHLPRRTRVVDEEGRSIKPWLPDDLTPPRSQPASPATPTRMSPVEERRSAVTVHTSKPHPTWEEQFAMLWDGVGTRLTKLGEYVSGKSAFDLGIVEKWSNGLRTVRVANDRDTDAGILESTAALHLSDDTGTMAGLRNAITARILADALAATP